MKRQINKKSTKKGFYFEDSDLDRLYFICESERRKPSSAVCIAIKSYYEKLKGLNEAKTN